METYFGVVKMPADAIKLFEACRVGALPRVQRRLSEKERTAIRSGSVFVWDEREAGMRRWTDGKSWSASRVSGSFLTYREMEGKRGSGFACRRGARKTPESGRGSDEDREEAEPEGYRYKADGLLKQSFSITTATGEHLHLISYYSRPHGGGPGDLVQPTNDPLLRHISPVKGLYPESSIHDAVPAPMLMRAPMVQLAPQTSSPQPSYGGYHHHHHHHNHHGHIHGHGNQARLQQPLASHQPHPSWPPSPTGPPHFLQHANPHAGLGLGSPSFPPPLPMHHQAHSRSHSHSHLATLPHSPPIHSLPHSPTPSLPSSLSYAYMGHDSPPSSYSQHTSVPRSSATTAGCQQFVPGASRILRPQQSFGSPPRSSVARMPLAPVRAPSASPPPLVSPPPSRHGLAPHTLRGGVVKHQPHRQLHHYSSLPQLQDRQQQAGQAGLSKLLPPLSSIDFGRALTPSSPTSSGWEAGDSHMRGATPPIGAYPAAESAPPALKTSIASLLVNNGPAPVLPTSAATNPQLCGRGTGAGRPSSSPSSITSSSPSPAMSSSSSSSSPSSSSLYRTSGVGPSLPAPISLAPVGRVDNRPRAHVGGGGGCGRSAAGGAGTGAGRAFFPEDARTTSLLNSRFFEA